MKNYDEVKRAAEAALRGLITTIYGNLKDEEAQMKSINYQLNLKDTLIEAKVNFDKGDINEADTF